MPVANYRCRRHLESGLARTRLMAKGGTPVMLAAPLAALDLPRRVLVRVRDDGQTVIAFHPIAAVLRRAGVPEALAGRLDPAQQILVRAIGVAIAAGS